MAVFSASYFSRVGLNPAGQITYQAGRPGPPAQIYRGPANLAVAHAAIVKWCEARDRGNVEGHVRNTAGGGDAA